MSFFASSILFLDNWLFNNSTNSFEAVWVDLGYFWKIFAELNHYLNRGALAVVGRDEEVEEAHLRTADGES